MIPENQWVDTFKLGVVGVCKRRTIGNGIAFMTSNCRTDGQIERFLSLSCQN